MTSPAYTASPGPVVCLHFLLDFPLATFVFESMYQRRQVGNCILEYQVVMSAAVLTYLAQALQPALQAVYPVLHVHDFPHVANASLIIYGSCS